MHPEPQTPYNAIMATHHTSKEATFKRHDSAGTVAAQASADESAMQDAAAENATPAKSSAPHRTRRSKAAEKNTASRHVSAARPRIHLNPGEEAPAPTLPVDAPNQLGRVVVLDITPSRENDVFPVRVELGETFSVTAQVFIEGRSKIGATAVLRNPRGREMLRMPMTCVNPGLDRWAVTLKAGEHSTVKPWDEQWPTLRRQLGDWGMVVEGWEDTYASWLHDARIKVDVHDDVENALDSGADLLNRWAGRHDAGLSASERRTLREAAKRIADRNLNEHERLAAADNEAIERLHIEHPLRDGISPSHPKTVRVERPKSSFTAWYQFFPRSEGATHDPQTGKIIPGNLRTSVSGLERAAAQGFDVVYLPPIFPIGVTNRKGRNNSLVAGPEDPGSPFGIGSELGGHDTVDPQLGTMDDFKALCARAHELNLEIALDFALQCSPDHPWVKEHPDWFRHKPDGTIAFAENPPKKYQDIYPIDFNADMLGIEREVERLMNLWIEAGVTIFRIDNPHTKPVRFWQDVIAAVTRKHPEVLFLAEAFTRPGMMRALSYVGFTQSHCYFPWRNEKWNLDDYLLETNSDEAFYQHNTFWPTTPDILTDYIRDNGIAGHAIRAVLAAMGSPSWGIYNGYELIENRQRPGYEEQQDNEKYEVKVRDWSQAEQYGIGELLASLNRIRRAHPACRSYHDLNLLPCEDESIIAFIRHVPAELTGTGKPDTVIVVVNLDAHNSHQAVVHLELGEYGLPTDRAVKVRDELTGREFDWGWDNFVSLAPWADVAHILSVEY